MTELASDPIEGHGDGIDIQPRDVRALTECMTVLPEGGDVYTVVGENGGGEYRVDTREGRCLCPDHEYRDARCKHIRRVTFATGETPIPAWIDVDAVDPLLGAHVDGGPRVTTPVAADGGVTVESDSSTVESEGRPDDCNCGDWNSGLDLPCWPCYRDGFESPAGE